MPPEFRFFHKQSTLEQLNLLGIQELLTKMREQTTLAMCLQKYQSFFRVYENRIEQCCATNAVQSCQQHVITE